MIRESSLDDDRRKAVSAGLLASAGCFAFQEPPDAGGVRLVLHRLCRGDATEIGMRHEHPILGGRLAAERSLGLTQQIPKRTGHDRVEWRHQIDPTRHGYRESYHC